MCTRDQIFVGQYICPVRTRASYCFWLPGSKSPWRRKLHAFISCDSEGNNKVAAIWLNSGKMS